MARDAQSAGVDQELVVYFDRRFSELAQELKRDLGQELKRELGEELRRDLAELGTELKRDLGQELKRELGEELRRDLAELGTELKRDLAHELKRELGEDLGARITASAAETRRHFDVVSERLMDKIQLVGEGVIGVDQKLDRFRAEVADEFRRVDRRLLRLEARVIG